MAKIRDSVRGFGQATIPSSMRAVTKVERDPEATRSLILRYVREHSGEKMPLVELAKIANLKYGASAGYVVDRLEKEGRIRRRKLKSGFTFDYLEVADYLDKGDKRNGKVFVVTKDGITRKDPYQKLAEAIVGEEDPQTSKTPSVTAETLFSDELDRQIWEFLKQYDVSKAQYQNTVLGETTQALRELSIFVRDRSKKENGNEHQETSDKG